MKVYFKYTFKCSLFHYYIIFKYSFFNTSIIRSTLQVHIQNLLCTYFSQRHICSIYQKW